MIDSKLKRIAMENALAVEKDVVHGQAQGCLIALSVMPECYQMSVYVGHLITAQDSPLASTGAVAEFISGQAVGDARYGLIKPAKSVSDGQVINPVSHNMDGSAVLVRFLKGSHALQHIQDFMADILPGVAPMTDPHACRLCAQSVGTESTAWLLPDDTVVPVHSHCVEAQAPQAAPEPAKPYHTALAILCAFIGALLGAVVWALVGMAGYIASIVGLLIGFLAIKGYDLANGRPGAVKTLTLIVCVILAVVIGTAGTVAIQLHQVYAEGVAELQSWEEARPELEFFGLVIPELMQDDEFTGSLVKDLLLGWFFAILGCIGLLRTAGKRVSKRKSPVLLNGGFGQ